MNPFLSLAALTFGAFIGLAFSYFFVPFLVKLYLVRRLESSASKLGGVCITFDDGPDPRATPKILETLERHSAKATFFVLAEQAERHPELIKAIVKAGHTIGEHSYSHPHAWKTGPLKTWADFDRGGEVLKKILDRPAPGYLRPPYGKMNPATLLYASVRAKKLVFWDIDPGDYDAASAQEIAYVANGDLERGSILLLHDGRRDPRKSPAITAEALNLILNEFDRLGLLTLSLQDVLD